MLICKHSHTHTHTQPGDPMIPVTLTDVDEDGVATIQLQGPGLNRLQQLMTTINELYKVNQKCLNLLCNKFTMALLIVQNKIKVFGV